MKSYRLLKVFLFFLVVIYIAFAIFLQLNSSDKDAYPIFTWSLFSTMPPENNRDYAVYVTSINGAEIPFPTHIRTESPFWSKVQSDVHFRKVVRRLGQAIREGDEHQEVKMLGIVKDRLRDHFTGPATFQVVRTASNPLEALQTGKFEIEPLKGYSLDEVSL